MIDGNQIVKIKWNNYSKKWYTDKGYMFTHKNDEFDVLVKDLMPSSKVRINVVCDYCGTEYESMYYAVMYGRKVYPKDACIHCASKKSSDISLKKRAKKYIEQASKICDEMGYTLLTTNDEFTDVKMKISFICPIHGKQSISLDNFLHGHRCYRCGRNSVGDALRHNQDYIQKYIESINGNKWLNYGEYINSHKHNLIIQCSCGNIFTTCFSSYIRAGVNTCYSCSCKESSGEKLIREFLENNNICYEKEKSFEDCRDKKPLPFDFYIPDYNLIIEFDGQHHFEDIRDKSNYETTIKHDKIKNEYCSLHNINLLRIPYWDGHNIENILKEKFSL